MPSLHETNIYFNYNFPTKIYSRDSLYLSSAIVCGPKPDFSGFCSVSIISSLYIVRIYLLSTKFVIILSAEYDHNGQEIGNIVTCTANNTNLPEAEKRYCENHLN